ncbi:MAG: AtpZ/AtpI family protein [Planctomycetaceae bacterium]
MVDNPRRRGSSQIAQAYQTANETMAIGLTLGVLVGGGWWLDQRFGCSPAFVVAGTLLGFLACGFSLRALLRRLDQQSRKRSREGSQSGDGHSE